MADNCAKCKSEFASAEFVAKCSDCSLSYHPACTRLGTTPNLTKQKFKSWRCDTCDPGTAKPSENVVVSNSTFFDAIKSLKTDINSNTDKKILCVMDSIKSLQEDFQKLETKFTSLETKQNDLDQRCNVLEKEQVQLGDQVRELRLQLRDTEQHSRCANIEITGIPLTQGENIYSGLGSVAGAIEVDYKREDVSLAHRLRLYSQKHVHPPIIVQFVSRSVKEMWISAIKRKRILKASEISPSWSTSASVYINEQLTPHNKALLGQARRLQREGKLHYAGFANGKVLVRQTEKEAAIRVLEHNDLDKFERSA